MAYPDPDPDLEKLLSDLSATKAATGSVPGGFGVEHDDGKSELTGRDYTVTSVIERFRPPRSISVASQRSSPGGSKRRIFRFPTDLDLFGQYCCTTIGQGPTICTAKNCVISHQGAVENFRPGNILILKNTTTAFSSPRTESSKLSPELLTEWISKSMTLDDWIKAFRVVENATTQGLVSNAEYECQELFASQAEAFKTPAKRKRKTDDLPAAIGISPYKRATIGEEDFAEEDANLVLDKVVKVVVELDAGLDHTSSTVVKLLKDFQENIKSQDLTATILNEQNNVTNKLIGDRPATLKPEYDSPSIWGAVAAIASKFDEIETIKKTGSFQEDLVRARADIRTELATKNASIDLKLNELKTTLVQASNLLSINIGANTTRIAGIERSLDAAGAVAGATGIPPPALLIQPPTPEAENTTKLLEERIETLAFAVGKLSAKSNSLAVKFGGLGFDSIDQSMAWLTEHVVNGGFELIVDPVVVMEHVWARISGECNIPKLEKMYKLKIQTLGQGLAMPSFERPIPRLFCNETGIKVTAANASYFDAIPTWEMWDEANTGIRIQLEKKLAAFETGHQQNIDHRFPHSSRAHTLASMSLTKSVVFCVGFAKSIDTYMKHLTQAKFGAKKAFHLTTQLGKRLWEAVSEPRMGVITNFQAGNLDQIGATFFWSAVRALDVSERIKGNEYQNDELIAAELVKFLALNTGFEAIDKLQKRVEAMETDLANAKRIAKAADKSVGTNGNKLDELIKRVTAMDKRLAAQEKRP